jgi:hypothetical protein
LDRLITSLMSPCCSHVSSAIIRAVSSDNLGQTLTAICRNCSLEYLGRWRRLKRDCRGLDSRLISLQVANTLTPFISKSYCRLIWST